MPLQHKRLSMTDKRPKVTYLKHKKKSIARIAVFHVDQLYPIYTFAGSLNVETYKYYLTNVIGSHPGVSLLADNASIHKTPDIHDTIKQQLHMNILPIPPYSPDLNPIEHMFKPLIDQIAKQHVQDEQQLINGHKNSI